MTTRAAVVSSRHTSEGCHLATTQVQTPVACRGRELLYRLGGRRAPEALAWRSECTMRPRIQMPLALTDRSHNRRQLPPVHETDLDRILKLIPTEVLALYLAAAPIAEQLRPTRFPLVLFLAGLALVPIVLFVDGRLMNAPARWSQYIARTLAFIAWAAAASWPFTPWLVEDDLTAVISLGVLVVPLTCGYLLRSRSISP
jgi:hypothetical protein